MVNLNANRLAAALVAVAVAVFASTADAQESDRRLLEVDLELVLAADRSGSISRLMQVKQRRGFAAAFRDEKLRRTIKSGPLGRVAVVFFEWSDQAHQSVVVPWTLLVSREDFERFADAIDSIDIGHPNGETAIGSALHFSQHQLDTNRYAAYRKVIDVSVNGRNSDGPPVSEALEVLGPMGVTVNGLVLLEEDNALNDGTLNDYYWNEVVSCPGAFAMNVTPERGFAEAILRKLVLEIAWSR